MRATFRLSSPAWLASPAITSSMSFTSISGCLFNSPLITWARRSSGRVLASEGWKSESLTDGERRTITDATILTCLDRPDGILMAAPIRYGGSRLGAIVVVGPRERREVMGDAARLRHGARLVRYAPPEIDFSNTRPLAADALTELAAALKAATGRAWKIAMVDAPGQPSVREAELDVIQARHDAAAQSPAVRAAMEAFPGAELIDPPPAKRSLS